MSSQNPTTTHGIQAHGGDAIRQASIRGRSSQREQEATADWHGLTLVHRGSELGVVGHVSREGVRSEPVLHAFGGISRSLEYAVPVSAIVEVLGVSARALVDDGVEFHPLHLCGNGRVILAPRTQSGDVPPEDESWRGMPPSAWIGVRVYADDGYLGEVARAIPADGVEPAEALIVRARTHLWKTHFPVIPVSRVAACTLHEHVARVAGNRHELLSMGERQRPED